MERGPDGTDWTAALLPGPAHADDERCHELLDDGSVADAHVLLVTYTASPDGRLEQWETNVGTRPHHLEVVGVGDSSRSASARGRGTIQSPRGDVTVSYVSPGDLTGLGIRVSERLSEWKREVSDGAAEFHLCFDSLSTLLQYVDLERAFQFLHVLIGRLHAADARGHFHLDPDAHDERTVATLQTLFDVAIDASDG